MWSNLNQYNKASLSGRLDQDSYFPPLKWGESLERRWKDGSLNTVGHLLQLWGEGSRHTGSRARMGRKKPDPSDIIWAPELTPGFTTGRVSYVSQYILFPLNPVLVGPITGNQQNPYTCEGLSAAVELKLLVFKDWLLTPQWTSLTLGTLRAPDIQELNRSPSGFAKKNIHLKQKINKNHILIISSPVLANSC